MVGGGDRETVTQTVLYLQFLQASTRAGAVTERPYLQFLQAIKRAGAIRPTTGWPGRLHAGCALDTRAARRTP